MKNALTLTALMLALGACVSAPAPVASSCTVHIGNDLSSAMHHVESRLADGCVYQFDGYFQQLLNIAEANPDADNKKLFSEHLVRVSDAGVISKRQAKALYNRYFNVKFVSLTGDYNTCSQTCPVQTDVMRSMRDELKDKERGLLKASTDQASYYRADHLLKEAQLVLEATCQACASGGGQ
jgi:hypothetical protein